MSPSMKATIHHLMHINRGPTSDIEMFKAWVGYENFMQSHGLKPWDEEDTGKGLAILKSKFGIGGDESTSDGSNNKDEASHPYNAAVEWGGGRWEEDGIVDGDGSDSEEDGIVDGDSDDSVGGWSEGDFDSIFSQTGQMLETMMVLAVLVADDEAEAVLRRFDKIDRYASHPT
ncbi:hypothetical protein BDN72DRAFT_858105 [Pluteus cervinus]|uniref:Uncharacterized protein n=1 Tax=Pluteus cervinus TaxID=181527 RepID=A0ACD3ASF8_9AGAR|nr:hypothetical protein BDN72DRAFT_858105 [Pluteus cervinus]